MTTRLLDWLAAGVHGARAAGAELLWPRACAACDAGPLLTADAWGGLCAECAATLDPLWPPAPLGPPGLRRLTASCERCAAPQRAEASTVPGDTFAAPGQGPCRDCHRLDPAVHQIRAAFVYEGALATALMRLKWQGRDDLAAPLGALLAPLVAAALERCDVVMPVPLHPSRLRARGYNQATLLLRAALRARPAQLAARPLVTGLLRRTLAMEPARAHGPRARHLRVAGAFAIGERHQLARRTRGLRVLLVDDVVTTGATVSACAAVLRAAGATHVEVVALLRASP